MANQAFQPHFSGKQDARRMETEYISTNLQEQGGIQSCTNYRGTKMMSHKMKLWERVIEHRLRRMTSVIKNQVWFHAWEVDHGSHFLGTTTYGEIHH